MKKLRLYLRVSSLFLIICIFTLNNSIFALSSDTSPAKGGEKYSISESGLDISELTTESLPIQLSEYLSIDTENIELTDTNAEDLYSIPLQNEDNSKTLYTFQKPIKFIDSKTNEIKFIDNTLETSKKSNGLFSNYAFENTAGDVKVYLPEKLNSGVLMETEDYSLATVPVTEKAATAEQKEQEFSGEFMQVVQYTNAFSDGAHLQYAAINSGLKENIFLEKYPGENVFSYIITAPGLVTDCEPDEKVSNISFLDAKTQEPVFTLNQPWARDSFDYECESDYIHMTQDCFYKVKYLENDNWLVSIEINNAFLENPETVYPVLIDPTQTISGGSAFSYSTVCQNGDRVHQ